MDNDLLKTLGLMMKLMGVDFAEMSRNMQFPPNINEMRDIIITSWKIDEIKENSLNNIQIENGTTLREEIYDIVHKHFKDFVLTVENPKIFELFVGNGKASSLHLFH